jgi:bifunctional NMN adenylyltransferase/nudix hydrolase
MKQYEYDLVVYIGRFQPFHNGHHQNFKRAAQLSENVLALIGTSVGPRTIKNPWTYSERKAAIVNNVREVRNLQVEGLRDYTYNDNKWIEQVGCKVATAVKQIKGEKYNLFKALADKEFKVAVIGHDKDHSSFYLNFFPQWEYINMPAYPSEDNIIDANKIRQLMFTGNREFTKSVMPSSFGHEDMVSSMVLTDEFELLQGEWDFIEEYRKRTRLGPYAPTFVTVDAIVEQSGHILLIQRKDFPGKGLWAAPGGFIGEHERLVDGMIRELREEAGLKVPEKVLRGSIAHKDVFDDPGRSTRGRTFTHAFLIRLDDSAELPRIKAGDDAKHAEWKSLAEFDTMQGIMYEDHFSMIKNMLARS